MKEDYHMEKKIYNLTEFIINQSAFKITYHRDIKVFSRSEVLRTSQFSALGYCTKYIY